jgi:hypothetical protein
MSEPVQSTVSPVPVPAHGAPVTRSVVPDGFRSGRSRLLLGLAAFVVVGRACLRGLQWAGLELPGHLAGVLDAITLVGALVIAATLALHRPDAGSVGDGLKDMGVAVGRIALIVVGLVVLAVALLYAAVLAFGP